tara:strand:- start:154 stop:297 length:144 start_codon:yes stop_codon:yes gene_type:complete
MNDSYNQDKKAEKAEKKSENSDRAVYVKEDDQDWGSSGMNNIQSDSE